MVEVILPSGTYMTGKLTPKQQLHLARRVAPWSGTLGVSEEENKKAFALYFSKLTDVEVDAIVDPCLSVCKKKLADGVWSPLTTPSGVLMYNDIGPTGLMEIVGAVIRDNLSNFSDAPLANG